MPDMLVKLYNLPDSRPTYAALAAQNITLRRALAPETGKIIDWIRQHFGDGWASEAACSLARTPAALFVAHKDKTLLGFACYDAVCRNFFGPTGVDESCRGQGIGKALLLRTLEQMRDDGYGYAIIGWVGPAAFYEKAVGASIIEDSEPGVYRGLL